MGMKVSLDLKACRGYALCMMESPNLFDIDDENGLAILLQERPAEELRGEAETAVNVCPAKAIALHDD